jgi:hypothetical protein
MPQPLEYIHLRHFIRVIHLSKVSPAVSQYLVLSNLPCPTTGNSKADLFCCQKFPDLTSHQYLVDLYERERANDVHDGRVELKAATGRACVVADAEDALAQESRAQGVEDSELVQRPQLSWTL